MVLVCVSLSLLLAAADPFSYDHSLDYFEDHLEERPRSRTAAPRVRHDMAEKYATLKDKPMYKSDHSDSSKSGPRVPTMKKVEVDAWGRSLSPEEDAERSPARDSMDNDAARLQEEETKAREDADEYDLIRERRARERVGVDDAPYTYLSQQHPFESNFAAPTCP